MEFVFTLHAKQQMVERGINKWQVINAIKKSGKIMQTDGLLASYGYIKVAFKIREKSMLLKR